MSYKRIPLQKKRITLNSEEKLLEQNFLQDSGYIARSAIWAYVENDSPIPNELKSILFDILQTDFKGKKVSETEFFWLDIVKEILFLIKGSSDRVSVNDAINEIANKHNLNPNTVERRYKKSEYRYLKDAMFGAK